MLLHVLRTSTGSSHQALEKLLIPQLKAISHQKDYVRILQCFYAFFQPLEDLVAHSLPPGLIPDISSRRKAQSLLDDLAHLGCPPPKHLCGQLPAIRNSNEALAVMYVMEGSTLGGSAITKMVRQKLALAPQQGTLFFEGYGAATGAKWQSFSRILDNYTTDEVVMQQMAHTADDTFIKFKNWIAANL